MLQTCQDPTQMFGNDMLIQTFMFFRKSLATTSRLASLGSALAVGEFMRYRHQVR
jgi:hypothetical protein